MWLNLKSWDSSQIRETHCKTARLACLLFTDEILQNRILPCDCFFNLFELSFYISIKIGLSPSKKNCVICFIESPLKVMKNAFYFILKAPFVLEIFKFFLMTFWSCRKNGLIRKVNFKIHEVTAWLTNNYNTRISRISTPNISRSKDNQTMKLSQLIEYNKRNIFLQ